MEKKFVLTVTQESDGSFHIETENNGFNTLEVIGIIAYKQHEIINEKMIPENETEQIIEKEKD